MYIETNEQLLVEDEKDDVPFVEFDISVSPADPTLEGLVRKYEKKELIVPFYQRNFVWKIEQASKLVESFLMGLPVPQVFIYINDDECWEIIDGQQRILSIKYFMEGFFGEADSQGKRQVFKLKGLSEYSEYNHKTFSELSLKDRRKLENSTLRAILIKQLQPSNNSDCVFHIFERLNTGGTQLKPQEIRNAVYRGKIVSELQELNHNKEWQSILGLRKEDKNQKDVELVLRLFSLYKNWENYEKPMLKFLNINMNKNREFSSAYAEEFKKRFPKVISLVLENIEKPFRPKKVINISSLEAVFIALLECEDNISENQMKDFYRELMQDRNFLELIVGSTTDTLILKDRIRIAKEVLYRVIK